jgi:IMP dehydrogenase
MFDLDMHREQLKSFGVKREPLGRALRDTFCYDDVSLVPKYSEVRTRSQINTSSILDHKREIFFDLPIFAASMDTIAELDMAQAMSESGCGAIIHRYNTVKEQCDIVEEYSKKYRNCMAAVGVTGDYVERSKALVKAGCSVICIDIAHGHHVLMKEALRDIRQAVGYDIHIMAGAVATVEGYNDLADWGADSVRCGIGVGSICSSMLQAGCGIPGLETILQCANSGRTAKIVADGGITNSGCIVKALAAGADFVILGSLLSGSDECPGEFVVKDNRQYKAYRGMASKEAQVEFKGHYSSYEGIATEVPRKGPVEDIIADLNRGIRSGFSYCGAKNIKELRERAEFVRRSAIGSVESSTHIVNKLS